MTNAEKEQIDRIPTPNLDRIDEIRKKSEAAGDVLHWIRKHSMYELDLSGREIEEVLADYYGVDLQEAQREADKIKDAITTDD